MVNIYNVSINMVLKSRSKSKLSSLPMLDRELIDRIHVLLSTTLGSDIKILIADQVSSGSQTPISEETLHTAFNTQECFNVLRLSELCEDINSPYGKYDHTHSYNYVSNIPVFVQSPKPIPEEKLFIQFNEILMNYFSNCFKDASAISFGLGTNEKLRELFEVDFDCMFNIGRTLGVNFSDLASNVENKTGVWGKEMYILPFFTLPSFSAAYYESGINILDKFVDWLRVFRATKAIFDLLGVNYKPIKGISTWLTSQMTKGEAEQTELFESLDNVYEEVLHGFENKEQCKTNLPAQLSTFEEASAGVLCSFLNWTENGHTVTKVYYPLGHSDIKKLDDVKDHLVNEFKSIKEKKITLDGSNENLLVGQLNNYDVKEIN